MREGPTTQKHKKDSRKGKAAIITLSDSRNLETDDSGILMKEMFEGDGHEVVHHVVIPDNESRLIEEIKKACVIADIIITDGGTGIASKDVTIEAVKPLFKKELVGFSALFATLSYDDIGTAATLSRATAGIIGNTAVFCLPGSPKAVKLAMERLILPEVGHIIKHLGG